MWSGCKTVDTGNHNPTAIGAIMPNSLVSTTARILWFKFDPNAVAYSFASPFHLNTNWNKLFGSSRCGYVRLYTKDSARLVWRRQVFLNNQTQGDRIELATYNYDHPHHPVENGAENASLIKPFSTLLYPSVWYRAQINMGHTTTNYYLFDGGGLLETKHTNVRRCSHPNRGYKLGFYFGGSQPAPSAVSPLALALAKTDVWEGHAGQTQATSSRMQNP